MKNYIPFYLFVCFGKNCNLKMELATLNSPNTCVRVPTHIADSQLLGCIWLTIVFGA